MAIVFSPTRGALRVLRGVGLATTSAALSVAAHAAAGGCVPDPGLTVLFTALLAGAGVSLADRQRGFLGIAASLGISQLALHLFLQITAMHGDHGHSTGIPFDPLTMLGAHGAAMLLIAIALTRTEAAIFAIARVLAWALPRISTPPLPRTAPRPVHIPDAYVKVLAQIVHQRIHALRGPPEFSC